MKRRFAIASAPVLVLLLLALLIPAALALANRHTSALISDRLLDAGRLASLTQEGLAGDPSRLRAELDAYAQLYDTPLRLVGRDGSDLHVAGPPAAGPAQAEPEAVAQALSGTQRLSTTTVWPGGPERLSLVVPVGHDSQVIAALVMEVPTDAARERVTRDWLLLGGLAVIPAGLLMWLAWPISAWVVRPLERLQQSMDRMRRGELTVRADTETGPPELQGVARAFNSMADTVVSTLERQQQFVADASHQLRNPLASMHIAVENMEPHLRADGESREAFEETLDTVQRMEHIVAGMLAATRLEHAARTPGRAQLVTVPPASVARWQAHADNAGGRLRVDMEAAAVPEPAGGLESLVDELVDNAFRLGGARTVVVRGRRLPADHATPADGAGYLIEIADDGQGLPPDELAQAGTRFWRSPRNQNTPGTGLGLSIVRQAVEDIGGSLELSAASGGGLIASLRLPLPPDGSGPVAVASHGPDGLGAADGRAPAPDES